MNQNGLSTVVPPYLYGLMSLSHHYPRSPTVLEADVAHSEGSCSFMLAPTSLNSLLPARSHLSCHVIPRRVRTAQEEGLRERPHSCGSYCSVF